MKSEIVGAVFARHVGDRTILVMDLPRRGDAPPGESVTAMDTTAIGAVLEAVTTSESIDISRAVLGRGIGAILSEHAWFALRDAVPDWPEGVLDLATTLDPDTAGLLERHRLMLRAGTPIGNPVRVRLETTIRTRIGGFSETSWERLAWNAIGEICDVPITEIGAEERRELSRRIRERLREKGTLHG